MACAVRSRIFKWDLIKLQRFCKAKDSVNKTKKATNRLGKDLTNPKSDRGIISNIYKELKKLESRKSNNPIKKWGTEINKEFSTEEYQRAEKHLKKYSTSLIIREMEIKTTL
jgi:DNA-binding transcriptional regulator GbsR (MarR family)